MRKKLDDLIRIEDAIKVLCRKTCHPGVLCPDSYCVEMWDEFKDVERVDAVPVVRCKDCKHNPLDTWFDCPISHLKYDGDRWCWKGERKDDDNG